MTLERGTLLNGRYRIVDILGQGGMGAVYRAMDENVELEVAVKENLFLSSEYSRQFRREAVILASLRHPSLPRVSDYFIIPGQGQYMVMDFIDGEDLRQRMERMGRLSEEDVILIGAAICDALTYLHTRQPAIIHRDIKPGNVKITPTGRLVLVDFGLAKVLQDHQATSTGARAMTPGFSPPEQYGAGGTDARTDVYSLAATLYAAITSSIPEDGLARATGNGDLTPVREINPDVSRRTANVIEKALAVAPEDRYQSAEEFKTELLQAQSSLIGRASSGIMISPPPEESFENLDGGNELALPTASRYPTPLPYQTPARRRRYRRWWNSSLMTAAAVIIMGSGLIYIIRPFNFLGGGVPTDSTPHITTQTNPVGVLQNTAVPILIPSQTHIPAPTASHTPPPPGPTVTLAPPTPTVTPVGGGLGKIAFVSTRTGMPQVWVMDPSGNKPEQVTNVHDGACQPSWSPDGLAIVFVSPCTGPLNKYPGASLYIWRKGEDIFQVPPSPEGDYDPAWSPDGKRIAFTSLRDGRPQVYLYNIADQSFTNLSNSVFADHEPAWNPAGSQLAFIRTLTSDTIWYMGDDGSRQLQYTQSGEFNDRYPFWSPDGLLVLFEQTTHTGELPWLMAQRYKERSSGQEFRIPPKGQPDPGPVRHPSISPDGVWIVFEGWPDGANHDIYRMTISGANFQRLTADRDLDFDPTWGPDPILP